MLRTRPLLLAVIAAASLALCVARPALATWPHNPSVNVPVVIAPTSSGVSPRVMR